MTRSRLQRHSRHFCHHRFLRRERGAAAVEFAIIATLLIPLVAGIIDFGTLFQKRQSVQDSTRAGARAGATTCAVISTDPTSPNCDKGNRIDHDALIMQALRARLGSAASQVVKITVYRSVKEEGPGVLLNGKMIGACRETSVPGGVPLFCNVYGPNELALVDTQTDAQLATSFSCANLAQYWCPTTRDRAKRADDAFIGVQVELRHPHVVRLFGGDVDIMYRSVFRLDPNAAVLDRPAVIPVVPPTSTTTTTTLPPPPTSTSTTLAPPPTSSTTTLPPPPTSSTTTTDPPPTSTSTTLFIPPTAPPPPTSTTTTLPPPPTSTTTTIAPPPTSTTTTLAPPPTSTTTTTTTTRAPRPCC